MVDPISNFENNYYTDYAYDVSRIEIYSNSGGDPIDLKSQFIEITIYESIFDNKIIGEVLLKDGLNLSETVPIVGNESIHIEYKTKSIDGPYIKLDGKITVPMGKARIENGKMEVYKLQFISNLQFLGRTRKINSSYKGTTLKIAKSIFLDTFGRDGMSSFKTNQDTSGNFKFIFPNWTPFFCINWLAHRSFSKDPSYFIFYEDIDGFHFKNVLKEIEKDPIIVYKVEPWNATNLGTVDGFMAKVVDYSISSYFDRMDEYLGGMYSGKLMTHDLTYKTMETHDFNYNDSFSSSKHLNRYPLFPPSNKMNDLFVNSKDGFLNYMPVQKKKFDGIEDNEQPENYFLERNSLRKQFTTLKITASVPGNSDIRLLDVVGLEIPKIGYVDETDTEWQDQYLSGKYIVTSMKTVINKVTGYITILEMAKDSLVKGIPDKFEKSGSNNK